MEILYETADHLLIGQGIIIIIIFARIKILLLAKISSFNIRKKFRFTNLKEQKIPFLLHGNIVSSFRCLHVIYVLILKKL